MSTLLSKETAPRGKAGAARKSGQRFLSLWFPYLPVERVRRRLLGPSWRSGRLSLPPLAVSRREGNALRIAALDEAAEALGLRRGMGLADARAMHPRIEIVEDDPAADRRLLEALADWCDRYTPLVALDGADGLVLDITGCAHLAGGERALMEEMPPAFLRQGFAARVGIAATAGAAWAAARFDGCRVVPAGGEQALFSPLPLAALRLDAPTRAGLESVGLRSVGAVMAAPRAPLARRFGAALLLRLDRALGRLDEAISPRRPVPALSAERRLAEPVTRVEDVEMLVGVLARTLAQELERRGEGARALALLLFRVDGAVGRIRVGTSRPLRDPAPIRRLFHERLAGLGEGLDAGCGFDLVRLCVASTDRLDARQADMAGVDGGRVAGAAAAEDGEGGLALLADRVRARLGERAVLRPVAVESHVPERAVALLPFADPAPSRPVGGMPQAERPIRLFDPPEPIEVAASEVPEGPPLRFRWRHALHRVSRAEGPERIAPEWWRGRGPVRDYFRIEDEGGRRYWLYRQGLHAAGQPSPRWFMHGLFP